MNKTLLLYVLLFTLSIYYYKNVSMDNLIYINTLAFCIYHYTRICLNDVKGVIFLFVVSKTIIKIPFEEYIFVCTIINALTSILLEDI